MNINFGKGILIRLVSWVVGLWVGKSAVVLFRWFNGYSQSTTALELATSFILASAIVLIWYWWTAVAAKRT